MRRQLTWTSYWTNIRVTGDLRRHDHMTSLWCRCAHKICYHHSSRSLEAVKLAWWRHHFPRYWLFVRRIHRSSVDPPHKGQWSGTLMFPLTCAWTNGWANNNDAEDLRRHHAHYDSLWWGCWNGVIRQIVRHTKARYAKLWRHNDLIYARYYHWRFCQQIQLFQAWRNNGQRLSDNSTHV